MKKYYKKDLIYLFVSYYLNDLRAYIPADEIYQKKLSDLYEYVCSKLDIEYHGDIVAEYVILEVEEEE